MESKIGDLQEHKRVKISEEKEIRVKIKKSKEEGRKALTLKQTNLKNYDMVTGCIVLASGHSHLAIFFQVKNARTLLGSIKMVYR